MNAPSGTNDDDGQKPRSLRRLSDFGVTPSPLVSADLIRPHVPTNPVAATIAAAVRNYRSPVQQAVENMAMVSARTNVSTLASVQQTMALNGMTSLAERIAGLTSVATANIAASMSAFVSPPAFDVGLKALQSFPTVPDPTEYLGAVASLATMPDVVERITEAEAAAANIAEMAAASNIAEMLDDAELRMEDFARLFATVAEAAQENASPTAVAEAIEQEVPELQTLGEYLRTGAGKAWLVGVLLLIAGWAAAPTVADLIKGEDRPAVVVVDTQQAIEVGRLQQRVDDLEDEVQDLRDERDGPAHEAR